MKNVAYDESWNYEIEDEDFSPLDTRRYGIPVYRQMIESLADLDRHNKCLIIARIDATRLDLVQAALAKGFFLCDTLTFWKGSTDREYQPLPDGYFGRLRTRADEQEIARLARLTFRGYDNHYSNDPKLDPTAILEGYVQWASTWDGPGYVIEHEESEFPVKYRKIVGFSLFRSPCETVLGAIAPDHTGKDLYKHLVLSTMYWGKERGEKELTISTQISNLAVQSHWGKLGLRPFKYLHTLHCHRL